MKQRLAPIAAAIAGVVLLTLVAWLLTDETSDRDWDQPGTTIGVDTSTDRSIGEDDPGPSGSETTNRDANQIDGSASDDSASDGSDRAELFVPLQSDLPTIYLDELPDEALLTLRLIHTEGPYPYSQDDTTFQNREGLLPDRARGHYREYTVETPGLSHRGARRIVAGDHGERYYTEDHYESFAEIADVSAHAWLRPYELAWFLETVAS